jgi:hypothetical protein
MPATPRQPVLIVGAVAFVGILVTGCTDNTGAIDQAGHNGYDRMACRAFTSMANDLQHNAITVDQATAEANRIGADAGQAGDPRVRQAGSSLRNAYLTHDRTHVAEAVADFTRACSW